MLVSLWPGDVLPCSRALWVGATNGAVVVGRTLDWFEPLQDKMWVFPRGMQRSGGTLRNPVLWSSRYGSLVLSAYDYATVEGMNEEGLVAHVLYLAESEYGKRDPKRPGLSTGLWAQYILDNFATVKEAVLFCRESDVQLQTADVGMSSRKRGAFHLALADRTGDSAIIEYLGGRPVIHHGSRYNVLTNSPVFEKQIAILDAFRRGGNDERRLPGSSDSTARFLRASYYLQTLPADPENNVEAVMAVAGIMRNVSAPFGSVARHRPSAMTTIWRSIIDASGGRYYFEYSSSPHMIWVTLDGLDFRREAPIKMLDIEKWKNLSGDQSNAFVPAAPFVPMRPEE